MLVGFIKLTKLHLFYKVAAWENYEKIIYTSLSQIYSNLKAFQLLLTWQSPFRLTSSIVRLKLLWACKKYLKLLSSPYSKAGRIYRVPHQRSLQIFRPHSFSPLKQFPTNNTSWIQLKLLKFPFINSCWSLYATLLFHKNPHPSCWDKEIHLFVTAVGLHII